VVHRRHHTLKAATDISEGPRNRRLGTEDNPVFAGMHDASALVVGATLAAARSAVFPEHGLMPEP